MTKKLSKEFLCKSFLKKLGKTCKDDFEKLQKEYVEDCTIHSQLHEWFKDEGDIFENDKNMEIVRVALHDQF